MFYWFRSIFARKSATRPRSLPAIEDFDFRVDYFERVGDTLRGSVEVSLTDSAVPGFAYGIDLEVRTSDLLVPEDETRPSIFGNPTEYPHTSASIPAQLAVVVFEVPVPASWRGRHVNCTLHTFAVRYWHAETKLNGGRSWTDPPALARLDSEAK